MNIFIKGMQMPSNCMECPMFNGAGCKATMTMFSALTNVAARVKGCPLVELPEDHGDFIDKQKLLRDVANMWYDGKITITGVSVSELIRQQETVIESEE